MLETDKMLRESGAIDACLCEGKKVYADNKSLILFITEQVQNSKMPLSAEAQESPRALPIKPQGLFSFLPPRWKVKLRPSLMTSQSCNISSQQVSNYGHAVQELWYLMTLHCQQTLWLCHHILSPSHPRQGIFLFTLQEIKAWLPLSANALLTWKEAVCTQHFWCQGKRSC